jgi:hypothetical protein
MLCSTPIFYRKHHFVLTGQGAEMPRPVFFGKDDRENTSGRYGENYQCKDETPMTSTLKEIDQSEASFQGKQGKVAMGRPLDQWLKEHLEAFGTITDNVGVGLSIISPDMKILALNKKMREWFPRVDVSTRPICYHAFNEPPRDEICVY